jgi:hypothetical protein
MMKSVEFEDLSQRVVELEKHVDAQLGESVKLKEQTTTFCRNVRQTT